MFNKSKHGKQTDIFHSLDYNKMSYKERSELAFEKAKGKHKSKMSKDDQLRMQGYAQAKSEETKAFKYKNPKYKRKISKV